MPKYRMKVVGCFDIEVEDDSKRYAYENTRMDTIENLLSFKTEDSIEVINVLELKQISE